MPAPEDTGSEAAMARRWASITEGWAFILLITAMLATLAALFGADSSRIIYGVTVLGLLGTHMATASILLRRVHKIAAALEMRRIHVRPAEFFAKPIMVAPGDEVNITFTGGDNVILRSSNATTLEILR